MTQRPNPTRTLDLRTAKCPLNFVKARLALEKIPLGEILEVWILAESESSLNIPKSIAQEGHEVVLVEAGDAGMKRVFMRRCR